VVGVFTGVALLAAAGALHGRRATAPWPFLAPVMRQVINAGAAPAAVAWAGDSSWAADRSVWTCSSTTAVTDVVLDLVECTPWASVAHAARDVLMPATMRQRVAVAHARSSGNQAALARVPTGMVERARQWLESHLADEYNPATVARAASTSARSLARHFAATHGMSPRQYLERLRVERACLLLQTSYLPVEEIGRACGLPDPTTLRRVFRKHMGELPGHYRNRYRLRLLRPRWGSHQLPAAPATQIQRQRR
jgi:transcriptional regulator GlxA family with amidase domain